MPAIAFELPEDIAAIRDGISAFIRAEVVPRHDRNHELLNDPQRLSAKDGRCVPEVVALMREVRMASSKAGYYTMCTPTELGGGGLGMLAYFVAWEQIYRT